MDTLLEVALIILGSSAIAAVTSNLFEIRKLRRSREDSARLLGLRIAFGLESYAIECAEMLNDDDVYEGTNEIAGKYMVHVPQCRDFLDSSDYTLVKPEILEEILNFPQRCKMAGKELTTGFDVIGDMGWVRTTAVANTAKLDGDAICLARRVRAAYALPERDLTFGEWNVVKIIERKSS